MRNKCPLKVLMKFQFSGYNTDCSQDSNMYITPNIPHGGKNILRFKV